MKDLRVMVNESIKEKSSYKKAQFDKDCGNYIKFIENRRKLEKFLEDEGLGDIDEDGLEEVLNNLPVYLESSENMAEDDEDEDYTYEEIVERAPEWLENNMEDEWDGDSDSLHRFVTIAVAAWNEVAKHKMDY